MEPTSESQSERLDFGDNSESTDSVDESPDPGESDSERIPDLSIETNDRDEDTQNTETTETEFSLSPDTSSADRTYTRDVSLNIENNYEDNSASKLNTISDERDAESEDTTRFWHSRSNSKVARPDQDSSSEEESDSPKVPPLEINTEEKISSENDGEYNGESPSQNTDPSVKESIRESQASRSRSSENDISFSLSSVSPDQQRNENNIDSIEQTGDINRRDQSGRVWSNASDEPINNQMTDTNQSTGQSRSTDAQSELEHRSTAAGVNTVDSKTPTQSTLDSATDGEQTLFLGNATQPTLNVGFSRLLNPAQSQNLLLTVPTGQTNTILRTCQQHPNWTDGEIIIIEVGTSAPTDAAVAELSGEGMNESVEMYQVSDQTDLSRTGITITQALSDWQNPDQDTVCSIHTLNTLLQYANPQKVFRFLHTLTWQMSSATIETNYTITSTESTQNIDTLQPLFDEVIKNIE